MQDIRADPHTRLPPRARRSVGLWRDARAAWALTLTTWRRKPLLFATALLVWGVLRFACLRGLAQAHLELGGRLALPELAGLVALAMAADLGPLVLAAALWPIQHRMILDAPAPRWPAAAARAARLFGVSLLLALGAAAAIGALALLPWLLLPALGRTSTLLSVILLLPAVALALICLLRLSFGLPALSLGLAAPLAEGWEISRFHTARALGVGLLATLPVSLGLAGFIALRPEAEGWAACLVRPGLDVVVVSLTGSLGGMFYHGLRLVPGLRPDARPSWNTALRREPIIS